MRRQPVAAVSWLLVWVWHGAGQAAEHVVAPNGSPSGDGTCEAPWDLATALSHPSAVEPGDTIWLRGGTYPGPFTSRLSGTAAAPIVVRAYPGESVRLDDSFATVLVTPLPAEGNAACTLEDGGPFPDASAIQIGSEQIYLQKIAGNDFKCLRGLNGTPVSSHPAGSTVEKVGPVLDSFGSFVWWWGFEITSVRAERKVDGVYKGAGLNLRSSGKGNKAINLIIHDTGHPGIGFWNQQGGGEVYGCLIWGTGIYDPGFGNGSLPDSRRGSAIYAQNDAGTVRVHGNIFFRNITTGLHLYSENGYTDGFDVRDNIVFDNATGQLFSSGGDIHPQRGLKMIGNYTWMRHDDGSNTARLGYSLQSDVEFRDNYIVGGPNASLQIGNWTTTIAVTGNTFVGPRLLSFEPNGAAVVWDHNRYHSTAAQPFGLNKNTYSFTGWKTATGFDEHSTFTPVTPADAVFVIPNKYEAGRGQVVVYNWSKKPSVEVDLSSILAPLARFEIWDAQNFFGPPAMSGTYTGESMWLRMDATEAAPVLGDVPTLKQTHTAPEFAVFVVLTAGTQGQSP